MTCSVLSFDGWRPVTRAGEGGAHRFERVNEIAVWRVSTPHQAAAALDEIVRAVPDLVHVHHGMLWDMTEIFAGLPLIFSTHVLQRELNRQRGVTRMTMSLAGQERALAGAAAVIAPSRAAVEILKIDYPDLRNRLHRIGFGVVVPDTSTPRPCSPCALYVGRFSDVKGTAELFAAIPRLLEEIPDLRVEIVGGNPESPASDRRWRRRFSEIVPEVMQNRIHFAGWLTPGEFETSFERASVLLCPSWFETFGLAVLEAMAHGLPVAATTGGALPELVEHDRTGLLAPPRDVDAFVANATSLLVDCERSRRFGKTAAATARQCYCWTAVAADHLRVYRTIIGDLDHI